MCIYIYIYTYTCICNFEDVVVLEMFSVTRIWRHIANTQKTQQYAQKRVRAHNATLHVPTMVSYSGVGIALCESTVV